MRPRFLFFAKKILMQKNGQIFIKIIPAYFYFIHKIKMLLKKNGVRAIVRQLVYSIVEILFVLEIRCGKTKNFAILKILNVFLVKGERNFSFTNKYVANWHPYDKCNTTKTFFFFFVTIELCNTHFFYLQKNVAILNI